MLYIIFEAINEEKLLWPIFGCKVGQRDTIVSKLDMTWHCLLDIYTKFQIDISKHTKKIRKTFHWLRALLTPHSKCSCTPEGQKWPNHDKKRYGSRHSQHKCVYQNWDLYMIFEAMNAENWLWPIFGCKVRQSVMIGMKLELDVWHHLLDVYTKFQTDISKHVEKSSENFEKKA